MERRPKKVKAKIVRLITQIAIVELDRDGYIEEIIDVCEEIDSDDDTVISIIDVITVQD